MQLWKSYFIARNAGKLCAKIVMILSWVFVKTALEDCSKILEIYRNPRWKQNAKAGSFSHDVRNAILH